MLVSLVRVMVSYGFLSFISMSKNRSNSIGHLYVLSVCLQKLEKNGKLV